MITWEEAEDAVKKGTASALEQFIYNEEPNVADAWRDGLEKVIEETRLKENLRLRTIFQDYFSFIPENHLKDLIEKLK